MFEQLEFFVIPNPCQSICEVNERGYCKGCLRSREERFNWMNMSDVQKRKVLRLCQQRQLRRNKAKVQSDSDLPEQDSLF